MNTPFIKKNNFELCFLNFLFKFITRKINPKHKIKKYENNKLGKIKIPSLPKI